MAFHGSPDGLWRCLLWVPVDLAEGKAGGAVIPLDDIWVFANWTLPSCRARREG